MVWSNKLCKFCQTNYYTYRARTEMLFKQILPSNMYIVSVCDHGSQKYWKPFQCKVHGRTSVYCYKYIALPCISIDCYQMNDRLQHKFRLLSKHVTSLQGLYQIMWHHFKDKHFVTTQLTMHSHVLNNWYTAA